MKVRQAELVSNTIHTIVWLPTNLCKKSLLLTDKKRDWFVLHAYKFELETTTLNQNWHVSGN